MCQKSAQLPYFEKVQHPTEKCNTKNFFVIVNSVVAKVYLSEKNFGGQWHLNDN